MALHAQQSEVQTLRFNKAISRFSKASKWHCSLQLFTEMKLANCLPDVITYSTVMDACGKGQKWQQALSLLSQMDMAVVRPNTYTYSCAIAACAKASAWIMAEALLKESFKEFSSCFSLGSAISACHGAGWERAQVLLEFGTVSSIQVDTPCFNGALSASRSQWLQALACLCSMRERLAVPNVVSFSSAISSLREGNSLGSAWPKSLNLLEKMSKGLVPPNLLSYNAAIDSFAKSLQWLFALELFKTLPLQSFVPDIISQSSVLDACEFFSWNKALGLFGQMASTRLKADLEAQSTAINACATGSQWPLAIHLAALPALPADVIAVAGALSACEHGSYWAGAIHLLQSMPQSRLLADEVTLSCGRSHFWMKSLQDAQGIMLLRFRNVTRVRTPQHGHPKLQTRFCSGQPKVVSRSLAGTFDLLTINVRHLVSSIKLRVLEVVYPNTWSAREFREGVAAAFQQVNSLLDEGDFLSLRQLLDEGLLEDLQKSHKDLTKGMDYELKEVYQLGIFRSMAKVDDQGCEAVFVTPLLRVTEKYTLQKDPKVWWEVRRLHKWTFKRLLPEDGEEASDWQIVAMDKKRWRPPMLKDEE